ncbi:hypothetical protein [Bacillus dicomae]|nr:hypothetical protein [Bacillus dicomae]
MAFANAFSYAHIINYVIQDDVKKTEEKFFKVTEQGFEKTEGIQEVKA